MWDQLPGYMLSHSASSCLRKGSLCWWSVGLIAINPDNYLIAMPPSATRSYHPSKFQLIPARIQIYKNSFFPRTVTWWNSLPDITSWLRQPSRSSRERSQVTSKFFPVFTRTCTNFAPSLLFLHMCIHKSSASHRNLWTLLITEVEVEVDSPQENALLFQVLPHTADM